MRLEQVALQLVLLEALLADRAEIVGLVRFADKQVGVALQVAWLCLKISSIVIFNIFLMNCLLQTAENHYLSGTGAEVARLQGGDTHPLKSVRE